LANAFSFVQASENEPLSRQKSKLVQAIANGDSVIKWAEQNSVSKRTAFRWAADPAVREKVEKSRRRALDRAIGHLSKSVNSAARGISTLAKTAESEPVRLAACKTVFTNMMSATEFNELKGRMDHLEELLHERERAGRTGQAG